MKVINLIKNELNSFNNFEKIFFPLVICATIFISYILKDNKIALISAICGISYTILAGKGKFYCYFIGIIGTFCYCYLSFKNGFYGNLALYGLYFLPMEIIGIFKWRKNLKKKSNEIIKTKLTNKERGYFLISFLFLSPILIITLNRLNGNITYIDGIVTILSVFGQIFTLKRCIEQWYIWFVVNLLSTTMWIIAYTNNSNCFATIIMWIIYLYLSIYFLIKWKKELSQKITL